ncbi:ABC transporter substrate-binding protein [Neiella holothuriorum]|nr:ABC transporter substrate-binding protein [Neiella holothuriorum]
MPKPKDGLVYCSLGTPSSFNPQLSTSANVVEATSLQLYDRLLRIDLDGRSFKPALATSWQVDDSGTRYRFKLRQNVQFHSTEYFTPSRPFNADDVVFSFRRIIDKTHPYHYVGRSDYSFFVSVGFPWLVKSVEAIDPSTVEFELFAPDSTFLSNLATNFAVILSADYGQQLSARGERHLIDKLPIGTGPFHFYRYKEEHFIKYRSHEAYWGVAPKLNEVVLDITPNGTMRLAKLLTGECDAMAFPLANELKMLREKPEFQVQYQNGFNVGYWAFNTDTPPLNDARVRKALALAINRDPIMEAVFYGTASIASSLLPPASWGYDATASAEAYDPQRARELLAEAGHPDGFDLDIWLLPVQRAYNPNSRKMALLLQDNLKQIGVHAHLVNHDWNAFRSGLSRGDHDSVLIGWTADNADPDNFFRPLLSCQAKLAGTNRAMWCDKHYDQLIDEARLATSFEKRQALYSQAQHYLVEQMPVVPIAHGMRTQASGEHVKGLTVEPFGGIDFSSVTIE